MSFFQYVQRSWRHYSQWLSCSTTQFEICCGCGMVHQVQYQLRDDPRNKKRTVLYKRVRVAHGRTRVRRRKLGIKIP